LSVIVRVLFIARLFLIWAKRSSPPRYNVRDDEDLMKTELPETMFL